MPPMSPPGGGPPPMLGPPMPPPGVRPQAGPPMPPGAVPGPMPPQGGGKVPPAAVLPPNHQLGMVVPKGGSMCANCKYVSPPNICNNKGYQAWNGSPQLPAPADSYCCDLWEGGGMGARPPVGPPMAAGAPPPGGPPGGLPPGGAAPMIKALQGGG